MRKLSVAIIGTALLAAAQAQAQDARGAVPYRVWRAQTAKALQKSASPRDWALASQMLETELFADSASCEHAALLRKAAEAAPGDHFVQWIWSHAKIKPSDCGAPAACSARVGAVAKLEPDNAAAWLPVFVDARERKDAAAATDALNQMAAAKHYDPKFGEAARAWVDVYRRYPPPDLMTLKAMAPKDLSLSRAALALNEAGETAHGDELALKAGCSRNANPQATAAYFDSCAKLGRTMMGNASSQFARWVGYLVLRTSGGATEADVPAIRTLAWQFTQFQKLADKQDAAIEQAFLTDVAQSDSEFEATSKALQRAGVALEPAADWQWMRDGKPVDLLHDAPAK